MISGGNCTKGPLSVINLRVCKGLRILREFSFNPFILLVIPQVRYGYEAHFTDEGTKSLSDDVS